MKRKVIYFVRHGETKDNENRVHQPPTSPLSDKGLVQAEFLAKRFETIPIDVVISSSMTRARQTADIIGEHTGHKVIESDLFREIRRPSAVIGKAGEDDEVLKIKKEIKDHSADDSWRHSDEENFSDLRERSSKALTYILARHEDNILVVTHGGILRLMIANMAFGDSMTADIAHKLMDIFATHNTGITKVKYDERGWYVLVWNDHAHLGETK